MEGDSFVGVLGTVWSLALGFFIFGVFEFLCTSNKHNYKLKEIKSVGGQGSEAINQNLPNQNRNMMRWGVCWDHGLEASPLQERSLKAHNSTRDAKAKETQGADNELKMHLLRKAI